MMMMIEFRKDINVARTGYEVSLLLQYGNQNKLFNVHMLVKITFDNIKLFKYIIQNMFQK